MTTYLPPTEEQQALRGTLRVFFRERWPETELRASLELADGHPRGLWRAMADELGLHGVAVPEELGGSGFDYADLLVVLEEMGSALVGGPFFASVALAAPLLLALPDSADVRAELDGVATGARVATVAVAEQPTRWHADTFGTRVEGAGPERRVTGEKLFVLAAEVADTFLVLGRLPDGQPAVLAVEPGAGVGVEPMRTVDLTRRQARVRFDGALGHLLATGAAAEEAVATMTSYACVALAAEQVGGAQRVVRMASEYAQVREQFGRPIGAFQAIKHQLSDALVAVEAARAALAHAGAAYGTPGFARAASVAKAFCSEVYSAAAETTIHVHGGIGFTWEHPAHLYYKRAVTSEVLLGGPRQHREQIAQSLLAPGTQETAR
ncbi:acyl-CoA/acyl-ACP dehydrogenase [Nocardioides anomalus]|uniref:Acyl-CoA/acyl-ACP dehydrogenase n=1 Tax=Nocardioides anomalus TaxID=2712223 RepID=A0A6G6WF51_9ACTN|nr:acyl-CoA dehydrogenase family protein [Nocardioides anomalus]QIG43725.1 acyl-CoA/acyl-ACP dehydrogenase [Nocardioides anomalus]